MTGVAVTNTTCLIVLERIGRLDILSKSFERILVPEEVKEEFGTDLDCCTVQRITNSVLLKALSAQLDRGEAAAIALATEVTGSMIILDDRKARRVARELGLHVLGTVGVLLRAKKHGVIPHVLPILNDFDAAGFHVSRQLRVRALQIAREETDC